MYTCPVCGATDVNRRARCKCGADLSVLQCLDAVPDAWFNQGLKALENGARGEALEWFAACCRARPSDAAARRALAKVWAQLGHLKEASRALEESATSDPDAAELAVIRKAISDASKPTGRKKRSSKSRGQSATGKKRGAKKRAKKS